MKPLLSALARAQAPILTVAITYAASVIVGILMVTSGNSFALNHRDQLVGDAVKNDAVARTNLEGNRLHAALMDFGGNLLIGSVPKSAMGLAIILPYPFAAYQGWIGGIVSVRGDHSSRLNSIPSATYYIVTLVLQLAAYSISVGAGVNAGLAMLRTRPPSYYQGDKWLRLIPKEALRDWGRTYLLATPLFLVASLWEFLCPWNV